MDYRSFLKVLFENREYSGYELYLTTSVMQTVSLNESEFRDKKKAKLNVFFKINIFSAFVHLNINTPCSMCFFGHSLTSLSFKTSF